MLVSDAICCLEMMRAGYQNLFNNKVSEGLCISDDLETHWHAPEEYVSEQYRKCIESLNMAIDCLKVAQDDLK